MNRHHFLSHHVLMAAMLAMAAPALAAAPTGEKLITNTSRSVPRSFAGGRFGGFLPPTGALRHRYGKSCPISAAQQKRISKKRRNVAKHKANVRGRRP